MPVCCGRKNRGSRESTRSNPSRDKDDDLLVRFLKIALVVQRLELRAEALQHAGVVLVAEVCRTEAILA